MRLKSSCKIHGVYGKLLFCYFWVRKTSRISGCSHVKNLNSHTLRIHFREIHAVKGKLLAALVKYYFLTSARILTLFCKYEFMVLYAILDFYLCLNPIKSLQFSFLGKT